MDGYYMVSEVGLFVSESGVRLPLFFFLHLCLKHNFAMPSLTRCRAEAPCSIHPEPHEEAFKDMYHCTRTSTVKLKPIFARYKILQHPSKQVS